MNLTLILVLAQLAFVLVVGFYFWGLLRTQQGSRVTVQRESRREMEKLARLRAISLSEPLTEKTRPQSLEEVIGQEEGIKALRAALCGPNPQHVIIYGPPGVGKTAAARLVLEEAKKNPLSPFREEAKFIELDATISRFDERGIADPLIGSVHDPIYQGAGPLGVMGVPQPKPGAVTRAHGGILFLDEIGELHPMQMNKLLKVLEDRRVFFESAYYNPDDPHLPSHVKDIFENGLPADFRLVGATTRLPEELPPALRSRCVEVFFRPLLPREVGRIARAAAEKVGMEVDPRALEVVEEYAENGREAVNIIQIAASLAQMEGRGRIGKEDVEWVVAVGQYSPRPRFRVPEEPQVGCASGLGVRGPNAGMLIEIEATLFPAGEGKGTVNVTGVVEEEEMGLRHGHTLRRKSLIRSAAENAITALGRYLDGSGFCLRDYHVHVNFPGGIPVDGPSAGLPMAVAVYSALSGLPVDNRLAFTGEVSVRGRIKPVGGVQTKLEAAQLAGAERVLIPRDNWQDRFRSLSSLQVIPVATLDEALELCFSRSEAISSPK